MQGLVERLGFAGKTLRIVVPTRTRYAACSDYLGGRTHAGDETQDRREHHLCANRRRTGETREHSRVVSRCPRNKLRRSWCPRCGSKTHAMTRTQQTLPLGLKSADKTDGTPR